MNDKKTNSLLASVAEQVIKKYDEGVTSEVAILTSLMHNFPMLTIASINSIIKRYTASKLQSEPKEKKKKEKTELDIAHEEIANCCATCSLHQIGRPCVLPISLCLHPELDKKMQHVRHLEEEKRVRRLNQKVNSVRRSTSSHNRYYDLEEMNRKLFDSFDEEISGMLGEDFNGQSSEQETMHTQYSTSIVQGILNNSFVAQGLMVQFNQPESLGTPSFLSGKTIDELMEKQQEESQEDDDFIDDFSDYD